MIRDAKVGQSVYVRPMKNKRLAGVVIEVETTGDRIRTVATDEGYHFVSPQEMWPSTEPPRAKATEDLVDGDVVVLFNGMRRTVESVATVGTPPRHRVIFREVDKPLTYFRRHDVLPGVLWRVIEAEEAEA